MTVLLMFNPSSDDPQSSAGIIIDRTAQQNEETSECGVARSVKLFSDSLAMLSPFFDVSSPLTADIVTCVVSCEGL